MKLQTCVLENQQLDKGNAQEADRLFHCLLVRLDRVASEEQEQAGDQPEEQANLSRLGVKDTIEKNRMKWNEIE